MLLLFIFNICFFLPGFNELILKIFHILVLFVYIQRRASFHHVKLKDTLSFVNYHCADVHKTLPTGPTINAITRLFYYKYAFTCGHYYDRSCDSVIIMKI